MHALRIPLCLALLAPASLALAASASLNEFPSKVLPVLVDVNAQGKVTNASPSEALSLKLNRLLMANLNEMISKPASDKHGRPMSSTLVMNLAIEATPLDTGEYSAKFTYVSSKPVPAGSWYWVHIDGHRLALANRNMRQTGPRQLFHQQDPSWRQPGMSPPPPPQQPPVQHSGNATPAAAPARGK